jgi:hypothetical protein
VATHVLLEVVFKGELAVEMCPASFGPKEVKNETSKDV